MARSTGYRAPTKEIRAELRQQGSRFLAIVDPARNESSVRDQIKTHKKDFASATHVCWAWRVGEPAREGRSDAGEPAGTAGTPILQVLRGAQVSDVLAVVVRWYGGVKLGKGGLARAYAGVVKEALAGMTTEMRRPVTTLRVLLPYDRVGDLKKVVHPPAVVILEESYGDSVEVLLRVEADRLEGVEESLNNFAHEVSVAGN